MVMRDRGRMVMAVQAVLEKRSATEPEADEDPGEHAEEGRAGHTRASERRTSMTVSTISTTVGR